MINSDSTRDAALRQRSLGVVCADSETAHGQHHLDASLKRCSSRAHHLDAAPGKSSLEALAARF
eukprot:3218029-Amphidinium_carterae.1